MMRKFYVLISVCILAFAAYTASAQAQQAQPKAKQEKAAERTLKPKHSGLTCFDCHLEEKPTKSLKVTCVNCHGTGEDVAKLMEKKYKEHYNPHNPLHYGTNALCENCHREHTPSKLECNNPFCHTEFQYKTP